MTSARLPFSQQATTERTGSCLKMYILRTSHFLTAGLKWKEARETNKHPKRKINIPFERPPTFVFSFSFFTYAPRTEFGCLSVSVQPAIYIYVLELNSQSRSHQNNSERFAVILMQSETLSSASSGCEIRPNYRHSVFTHTVFPFPSK